jgi:hypothetical protein
MITVPLGAVFLSRITGWIEKLLDGLKNYWRD